jgi:hypothetical protein
MMHLTINADDCLGPTGASEPPVIAAVVDCKVLMPGGKDVS